MRLPKWIVGTMVLLAACGGGDDDGARAAPREPARPPSPDEARAMETPGGKLYIQACIMCHGEGGRGTPLGPPLAGAASTEQVAQAVAQGVADPGDFPVPMPDRGDGTFGDEEIRAVSDYVASLGR